MRLLKEIIAAFNLKLIVLILVGNILIALVPVITWSTYAEREIVTHPGISLNGDDLHFLAGRDTAFWGTFGPLLKIVNTEGLKDWSSLLQDGILSTEFVAALLLYLLFWIFITGGILRGWQRKEPLRLAAFGRDALELFPANALIFIVQAGVLFLLYRLVIVQGYTLVEAVAGDLPTQWLTLLVHWIPVLLFLLLLFFFKIIFDFMRVGVAMPEERSVFVALIDGLTSGMKYLPAAFLTLVTLGVILFGITFIWSYLRQVLTNITVTFIARELFMILRIWITLAWFKGIIHLKKVHDLEL